MVIQSASRRSVIVCLEMEVSSTREAAGGALESLVTEVPYAGAAPRHWMSAAVRGGPDAAIHPWDEAHGVLDAPEAAGLEAAAAVRYIEPDFVQSFPYTIPEPETLEAALEAAEPCRPRGMDQDWPTANFEFGWHLEDDYTQLRAARNRLGDPGQGQRIRIGILDTGYDPGHVTRPGHLRLDLARNFTSDGSITDATDPGSNWPLTNPGHGTATLALLAGAKLQPPHPSGFADFLGGAPFAEVVPIRIADSVVHFRTSSMARGIEYAADAGCQVLSISMGGYRPDCGMTP